MILEDIMTKRIVTVEMDDQLREIKKIFDQVRFHHLMVVNRDRLVGVISDRDLLKNISPFLRTASERIIDLDTLDKRAHQIMSRSPMTATPDMDICEAADFLVKNNISCLPVVTREGELVGIVSWKDILRHGFCSSEGCPDK